jgi:hypothetical protein
MLCEYAEPYKNDKENRLVKDMGIDYKFMYDLNDKLSLDFEEPSQIFEYIVIDMSKERTYDQRVTDIFKYVEENTSDGAEHVFFRLQDMTSNFGYGSGAVDFFRSEQ